MPARPLLEGLRVAIARFVRAWANHVLVAEGDPPREAPRTSQPDAWASASDDDGAPAHWVEAVRARAPHLLAMREHPASTAPSRRGLATPHTDGIAGSEPAHRGAGDADGFASGRSMPWLPVGGSTSDQPALSGVSGSTEEPPAFPRASSARPPRRSNNGAYERVSIASPLPQTTRIPSPPSRRQSHEFPAPMPDGASDAFAQANTFAARVAIPRLSRDAVATQHQAQERAANTNATPHGSTDPTPCLVLDGDAYAGAAPHGSTDAATRAQGRADHAGATPHLPQDTALHATTPVFSSSRAADPTHLSQNRRARTATTQRPSPGRGAHASQDCGTQALHLSQDHGGHVSQGRVVQPATAQGFAHGRLAPAAPMQGRVHAATTKHAITNRDGLTGEADARSFAPQRASYGDAQPVDGAFAPPALCHHGSRPSWAAPQIHAAGAAAQDAWSRADRAAHRRPSDDNASAFDDGRWTAPRAASTGVDDSRRSSFARDDRGVTALARAATWPSLPDEAARPRAAAPTAAAWPCLPDEDTSGPQMDLVDPEPRDDHGRTDRLRREQQGARWSERPF